MLQVSKPLCGWSGNPAVARCAGAFSSSSIRYGSRFRKAGVPTERQMGMPAPSDTCVPGTTCTTGKGVSSMETGAAALQRPIRDIIAWFTLVSSVNDASVPAQRKRGYQLNWSQVISDCHRCQAPKREGSGVFLSSGCRKQRSSRNVQQPSCRRYSAVILNQGDVLGCEAAEETRWPQTHGMSAEERAANVVAVAD